MAWWFHPDRAEDVLRYAEKSGAVDTAFSESDRDGVRVRTYLWKDRLGWAYRHRAETHLAPDGRAERSGGRFVAPTGDTVSYTSPRGEGMTKTCVGRIEFAPLPGGSTEVRAFHSHSLEGGRWFWRVKTENQDRANTVAMFHDTIDRCQEILGSSSDNQPRPN